MLKTRTRAKGRNDYLSLCVLALAVVALLIPHISAAQSSPPMTASNPFLAADIATYRKAIASVPADTPAFNDITGLIVPHHLVAADLMARAYHAASNGNYDRIIVLSPDHFYRANRPFATTKQVFDTPFGSVATDDAAIDKLLQHGDLFENSALFRTEHGILVHLPFIRDTFKNVPVVPIAVSLKARQSDWDRATEALKSIIDERTLVIQSTDFSHYLPRPQASKRDQEVMNLMAAGNLQTLTQLRQPDHIDSLGALYLQLKLQSELFGTSPVVIANRNSQDYMKTAGNKTTSYVVALFKRHQARLNTLADGKLYYFAGDTLIGRHLTAYLADELIAKPLENDILSRTGGNPLILNLEGVVLTEIPRDLKLGAMTMSGDLVRDWLRRMHVVAVGIANNHSGDLGPPAFAEMESELKAAGVKILKHGDVVEFGSFSLAAISDLSSNDGKRVARINAKDIARICTTTAAPPLFAFIHWGKEGRITPEQRERDLAQQLHGCAVSTIVGAHSHKASKQLEALSGGETLSLYSLGNFLFDQSADKASGALLEVRIFPHGTSFARLLPLPNYYDLARSNASR